jgi:hypothetical protein
MGQVLEIPRFTILAEAGGTSLMAARFLGYGIAEGRQLRGEVGIHLE